MNEIMKILKLGWIVEELRYDRHMLGEGWYYLGARHETGEATVEASGTSWPDTLADLCRRAKASTPQWYEEQLEAQGKLSK